MSTIATDRQRICNDCGRLLPITEFRLRSQTDTARRSQCRECFNRYLRLRRARRRMRDLQRFAREVKRQRSGARIAAVTQAIVTRFGGLDRFATAWKEQFDAAWASDPGSRRVSDLLLATLQMCKACDGVLRD